MTYAVDPDPNGRTCVYRLYDQDKVLLYVGMSRDPQVRWRDHEKKPWWPDVADRQVVWHATRGLAHADERAAIKREEPLHNLQRYDGAPAAPRAVPDSSDSGVAIHLDYLLRSRGLSQVELAERVGIHTNNLSRLRNGHVSFIRLDTLGALCRELECQPGELLTYE